MPKYGPRFDSRGYQFPRTHAQRFSPTPGPPLRELAVSGGSVRILLMRGELGGRAFEVVAQWRDRAGAERMRVDLAHDEVEALAGWHRALERVRRG